MLVVDSILTIIAWLPNKIFWCIFNSREDVYKLFGDKDATISKAVLTGILLTNTFTTPLVYFSFNKNFRVSYTFI